MTHLITDVLDWPRSSWMSVVFLQENRADWELQFAALFSIDERLQPSHITSLGFTLY